MSEDYPDSKNIRIRDRRLNYYRNILKEQFYLSYYGHINYSATDIMNIFERKNLYNILLDQKNREKEKREEYNKKIAEKGRQKKRPVRHR